MYFIDSFLEVVPQSEENCGLFVVLAQQLFYLGCTFIVRRLRYAGPLSSIGRVID